MTDAYHVDSYHAPIGHALGARHRVSGPAREWQIRVLDRHAEEAQRAGLTAEWIAVGLVITRDATGKVRTVLVAHDDLPREEHTK